MGMNEPTDEELEKRVEKDRADFAENNPVIDELIKVYNAGLAQHQSVCPLPPDICENQHLAALKHVENHLHRQNLVASALLVAGGTSVPEVLYNLLAASGNILTSAIGRMARNGC